MPQPDNVKALYNELKNTYELGSEEDFIKYLSDDKNREALRKELESEYDVGDIASFSNYLGFGTGQAAYEQYMAQRNGQSAPAAPTAAQQQPKRMPAEVYSQAGDKRTYEPSSSERHPLQRQQKPSKQQPTQQENILEQEGNEPLGPERFAKAMEAQQSLNNIQKIETERREAIQKGNTPFGGQERRYNPVTKKFENVYYTPTGDVVGSETEQQRSRMAVNDAFAQTDLGKAYKEAQRQADIRDRAWGERKARMRGYDKDFGVASEEAWNMANERTTAAQAKTALSKAFVFGDPLSNAVMLKEDQFRNQDLTKMSDDAWNNLGKEKQEAIIEDYIGMLKSQYSGGDSEGPTMSQEEAERILREQAEKMARAASDQKMYEVALAKNAPENVADFFMRKVIGANMITKLIEAAARATTGSNSAMQVRDEANQKFEDSNKAVGLAGTIVGMGLDPTTWAAGAVGGAATKGALWLGGKVAGEAATRKFATTLAGRTLSGIVGGAGNFGTFESANEMLDQVRMGGHRNEETGEIEGYDLGAVAKRFGHGVLMGSASGTVAPLLGNVSDKLVNATSSTFGKAGVRAGELGVSTLAEGTIFSIPEWIDGDRDAMDVWTDNLAMMLAFKGQHVAKSGIRAVNDIMSSNQRIAELRGLPRREVLRGLETRLRDALNGHEGMALTREEADELKKAGYDDLNQLVEDYNDYIKSGKENGSIGPERQLTGRDGEIPYNRFEMLMNDGSVSEAARAKMYYYLTGKTMPMSTVMGSSIIEYTDDKGNVTGYTVRSIGANGVITSRNFNSKSRAAQEVEKINRQVELNSIDIGERYCDRNSDQKRMFEACETVARAKGVPARSLYEMMQKDREGMSDVERTWVDEISKAYDEIDANKYASGGIRNDINEEYKVNIDSIIKKEPKRRSEWEQSALDDYVERLWADVQREENETAPDGRRRLDAGDPSADRETDAFNNGYDADEEGQRDIMTEAEMGKPTAERQAAVDGVRQRISDDADMMAAEQREEAKKKQFRGEGENKGTLRPVKITQQSGEPREVFLTQGEIVLTDSGLVDPEKTKEVNNVGTLTGYDPATGEEVQFTPADIVEVEPMTTAEQQEQNIEANKQAYIQQQMDAATPTATTTDPKATTSATTADNQQQEPAPAKPKGEPKEFVPGMTLTVTDREGNEHTVTTDGKRYTYNPVTGELTESENGNYLNLTDKNGDVLSYDLSNRGLGSAQEIKDYEMPKEEQPTETVEPTEQPTAEVPTAEGITPQQQVTPESTPEPAPVEKADPMKAPMPMRTVTTGKGKNAKTETVPDFYAVPEEKTFDYIYNELGFTPEIADATVKANADETAKAINEHKAKEPQPMANPIAYKEAHDAWQRDLDAMNQQADYWKKVQSIRNQQLLAEAEERDKATRAERERRQKEIEAARKREEEAYQAELARRKAERDKKMEASINNMIQMSESEEGKMMEQMAKEFPIEQDAEAMEIMNDRSPRTLEEVVAWMLSDTKDTKNKIDPELVREHTGYGKADFRKFPFIFKKGGMSPEAFGEKVEQIARENDVVFKDNENGFSALLNVLGEVGGLGDLKNYIKNNRIAEAEKLHSDRLREAVARQAEDKSMQQNSGMNDKQQDNYMASMEQAVESGVTMMTDEETEALFSDDAVDPFESKEENQKTNSNDTRTETNDEGGDQRGAEKGGADESEAGQAGVAADDKRGDIQLEGEPQPAEQPAGEVAEESESKEEVKGETNESDAELDALIADYKEKQSAVNKIWNNWLKDKSGAPAKYGNSREIEQEAYDKIRKALRNVSDEQLDGLAKRLADDNLLMFLIEGEQNRREENRERANEFPNGIAEQGDISKESKPVKTDKILPDFTSRDPQHPVQNCIYYDPDGHAVATDGHVLIASKSQYDPKQKGKMVAAHKVKGAAEKGDVLEGKFPNWKSVIPAESEQKTKINLRKLANFLAGAKDIMKGEKEKESSVIVRMPNGDIVGFDPDNLQKFVQAADAMGVKEVEYGSFDKPLIGRSNDGIVVVMPKLIGTSYDGKKFYYDLSDGSIKQQKTGGEATKTSERDRRLLEVVMDKLRNIIGDRLHTTLTEDEKGLINWARAKTKGTAPVFYSNAERAVEGIKQEKATAEQWLAMIQKAGGLKAGEDKWMGLSDWLNDHKGKSLTKQEVLDFIRDNQIRMEEVNYAEDGDYPNYAEEMETRRELVAFEDEMSEKYGNGWENKLNEAERLRFENLNSSLENYKKSESRPINDTRLKYTTDFLDNKREIAFVVSNIESWNESDEVHFGDAGEGRVVMWVRFGETTDKDGKKVLVIDEIQSNRHQEGREMGYKYEIPVEGVHVGEYVPVKNEKYADRISFANVFEHDDIPIGQIEKIDGKYRPIDSAGQNIGFTDYDTEEEAVNAVKKAYATVEGIPDAPFEKNWHEVAMKRMLRYAAENGYDKVAWTTGEQQAERYSLGHKVYQITSTPYEAQSPSESDGHDLMVNMSDGTRYEMFVQPDGTLNSNEELFDGKNVADVFGKELGNKIMSATEETDFSGNDLRVGAEGMKGFYDQILPRFMDKYGKKWGVKTTDVELPNVGDNGLTMHSVEVTPEMKKSVLEGQPMFHKVFHGSGADFERFDSSHMGEGEGAQAYGYGHYTTEVEGIGRTYAESIAGKAVYKGKPVVSDPYSDNPADRALFYMEQEKGRENAIKFLKGLIKDEEDADTIKEYEDTIKALQDEKSWSEPDRVLYTVEIPDDNGSNYLEWDKPISEEQLKRIEEGLLERGIPQDMVESIRKGLRYKQNRTGKYVYDRIADMILPTANNPKQASEFLHSIGFTGIKYPAQYRSGGREDNAKNYVIFDDGDLKITDKIKFFKTPQGEVYGFTVGGNIYVDMDIAKADTPIHEYGHLWVPMVRESDPEMWEDIKSVLTKDKDVKPFMDIVRQRYPELTAEGREDDFMEEVFTHFSGDNGLKMLEEAAREYEEQDGQGFISKAKAIAALNKVKEALNKFWGKVAQLFGIKFRNAREVANKMFKDFMDEVDPMKVRTERIKNEGLKPEEEKTLMAAHNISEEKLRKALKQGGFANPSMAVVDTKIRIHDEGGEISLIPKSSLIDSRSSRNAVTYGGDAWTSMYPTVEKHMSDKGADAYYKDVNAVSDNSDITRQLKMAWDGHLDGRNSEKLAYWYLKDRGIEPENALYESGYTEEQRNRFSELTNNGEKHFEDMTDEERNDIIAMMAEEEGVSIEEKLEQYQRLKEKNEALLENGTLSSFRQRIAQKVCDEIDKYGVSLSPVNNFMSKMQIALENDGELNIAATLNNAFNKVQNEGMISDFNRWLEEKEEKYGVEEKIFNGYYSDGMRKYLPNTLENASMVMNNNGDANALDSTSLNATRADLMYKMQSLDDIRKHRDLLSSEEEYDKRQDEMTDKMLNIATELGGMQKISDNTFANIDYAIQRMQDAFTKKDPIGYLNKEYGYNIDKNGDFAKKLLSFMKEVRDLPVKYFETKFRRPVMLDEFAIAIVPEGTSEDVVKALQNAGLDVRTYDGTSENRQAVTLDAVKGRDDIMFQKAEEPIQFSQDPKVQKNIEKGLDALRRIANGEEEVSDAMRREELADLGGTADIAFIWGQPGRLTPQGRYKGGEGFSKIIEKHGIDDAIKVVETIAKGEIGEPYGVEGGQRVDIDNKDHHTTVSLFRNGVSKSWVLTGYTIDNNTDAKGRGSDLSNATQSDPIRTRAELGAALKSDAKIIELFETAKNNLQNAENESVSDGTLFRSLDPESDEVVDNAEVGTKPLSDREKVAKLEAEPKVKVYRSMQLIDGKLYPPMSAKVDGQLREPSELGVWEEADEAPDMADDNGKFKLDKGNRKSLKAAYNPYIHTSRTMLNDQFSEAQDRPNLVVVEMEVPESELTSGYKAEKAKDSVGAKQWKAGVIQGQLSGTREVILSRWAKPVRIVPTEEVADNIAKQIEGQVAVMPSNVVTPEVRAALEARGVKFVETDNTGKIKEGPNKGKTWAQVYGKKAPKGREADSLYVFNPYTPYSSYEESLEASKAAGYSKRQHDAMVERRKKNYAERGQRAKDFAEKLNLGDRVVILENADGLEERFQDKKGWYNPRTGKITIVLDKHGSMDDILQTILHEGVGHHGLRAMFGMEFDNFLDNVYAGAEIDVRKRIIDLAKNHGWVFRTATEEYLSQMAETMDFEKPENKSWWQKVKKFFLDMLHKLGIKGAFANGDNVISDNELSYILWRSYQNLVNPGRYRSFVDMANDVVMQDKLKVGNFAPKGANTERNEWREEVPMAAEAREGDGIVFRDGGNVTVDKNDVPRAVARDSYERMMDSGANQFKEAVQDSMLSLKKLYEAILGKGTKIEDVEGYKNAYLAENRMHSASQAEIGMWHKDFMEPVVKAIHELTGGKRAAYDDLVKYMMAKHGLERNAVFAERDAQAAAKKGADYDDELQKNRGRDYAGLTALTGEDDVANAEGMAQKMVDDYEADHDTTELWNAINRATKQSLWKLASSGMMTPERYNEIRDMFSYYIPLQGFDETVAENVYSYMGNDGTIGYGTPIRHARGRKSLADDPIATMAMNGEAAIRQANRNEMKKRFLAFAQEHPSDLVSVSEVWLKHNDVTGEWEQVTADLNENDSPADVERKTMEFDEKMEQLASNDPDHYKKASDIPNVPFRVVEPSDMKQHQVLVQRGGKKYMLTINGNPRAAQALNGLTNPDVFTEGVFGKAMNLGQWLNRQLSAFYTTRNPEFVLSNFLRDAIYSNSMSWVKENPNYALKFHKNFGKMNPVHMGKLFAQWENGKLRERIKNGTASETDQLFYDFMTNGGETGWTSLRDIEKHKKELQSSLKREGSTSRKAWKALGEAFDLMNRSVENCARFAAFVTSREMGRSIDRSISDAKEVSVNFNKKGAGDKFLTAKNQNLLGKVGASMGGLGRGLYVFFNASMQGLNNIARATKRHPGKAAGVYSTLFALGALAPILAEVLSGGDDDDDKNAYYNLPEYIRRSNICFRFGKDMPWITIPLPIEFRAIYGLGELSTGALTGKEHYTDEEFAKQYVSQLSQVLPLDFMEGGGGWHAFVPSMIKPYVEAQSNTSWTGLPIYRDNTFKPYDPEWTRAYSSANKQLVDATKWLNEATGGDDVTKGFIDWNPAKIEYMLKGYLGGYFTMYDRLQKTAETALGNRDFEWRNIPMASRVLREGDERTEARKLTNEYFDLVDEYNDTKHKVKEYEKISKSDREDAIKYAQKLAYLNNSEEYTRYLLMEYYKPILDQFHDMVKEADGEQSKRIKGEENALRRELINIIHSIDDGAEIDVDAAIDEMLMGILNDEQSDISLRKKAQNTVKKHRKAMAASQQ